MSSPNLGDKLKDFPFIWKIGLVFEYEGEQYQLEKTTKRFFHVKKLSDKSLWRLGHQGVMFYATYVRYDNVQEEDNRRGDKIIRTAKCGDALVWETRRKNHAIIIFSHRGVKKSRGRDYNVAIGEDPWSHQQWTIYAGSLTVNLGKKVGAFIVRKSLPEQEVTNVQLGKPLLIET